MWIKLATRSLDFSEVTSSQQHQPAGTNQNIVNVIQKKDMSFLHFLENILQWASLLGMQYLHKLLK